MKLGEKVAGPMLARFSSRCPVCGTQMRGGWDQVVKVTDQDKEGSTHHGQGPGTWVHESCWKEQR